jgi:hypothetical protein
MSWTVMTPYYSEDVLYSRKDLEAGNTDGVSTLLYLQTLYKPEWKNFLERLSLEPKDENKVSRLAGYRHGTITSSSGTGTSSTESAGSFDVPMSVMVLTIAARMGRCGRPGTRTRPGCGRRGGPRPWRARSRA